MKKALQRFALILFLFSAFGSTTVNAKDVPPPLCPPDCTCPK